jgi:hypothetical protein
VKNDFLGATFTLKSEQLNYQDRLGTSILVGKVEMKRAFFLQGLRTTPPAPGEERVLYPGLVGGELRRQRLAEGIPYHPEVMNWFEEAAEAINHAGTETSFFAVFYTKNRTFAKTGSGQT